MQLPFFLFLIPYVIGLCIFFVWAAFNVWHMKRFALFNFSGKLNTVVFLLFSVLIIALTIYALKDIPWFGSAEIDLSVFDFANGGSDLDGVSF